MTVKEEFKACLDYLHEQLGIPLPRVHEVTGIKLAKLKNIRKHRSSGNLEDLEALKRAYPQIRNGIPVDKNSDSYADKLIVAQEKIINLQDEITSLRKRNQELEEENRRLKKG